MKKDNYKVISIEQTAKSMLYTKAILEQNLTWDNTIYIFGNEIIGVKEEILSISDLVVEIPMYGKKNSLNVSVTVGIIAYEARKSKT